MEWLKGYILTITIIGIASILADVLLPEGNIKKFARFTVSLVLSLALCAPVISLIKNSNFSVPQVSIPIAEQSQSSEQIEQNIDQIIKHYTGFENATASVEIDSKLKVLSVTIEKNVQEQGIVDTMLNQKTEKNLITLISTLYGVSEANIIIKE